MADFRRDVQCGLDAFDVTVAEAILLLDIAEAAIRARLCGNLTPAFDDGSLSPALRRPTGVFVTLHVAGRLNGCTGNIDGSGGLAADVAELAVSSAVGDPSLPALRWSDLDRLSIEISLLSRPVGIPARSRDELLRHLRRGEHGLIIRGGHGQALLLPSVWDQLADPDRFVDQLFHQAGLPRAPWPDDLVASVFTTATIRRDLTPTGVDPALSRTQVRCTAA